MGWKGNHSQPPMGGPMPSQFPSKRWVTFQNALFSLFIAVHDVIWQGIPLWLVRSSASLCPLPAYCTLPSLFTRGAERETEKALTLCKHCSATPKIWACYQHCFSHKPKHSPIAAAMKKTNSIPVRLSTETHTSTSTKKFLSVPHVLLQLLVLACLF